MESRIGAAAGEVWRVLSEQGAMSGKALAKATGLKSELLNQAIGWLAREGKVVETAQGKKQLIALKQ